MSGEVRGECEGRRLRELLRDIKRGRATLNVTSLLLWPSDSLSATSPALRLQTGREYDTVTMAGFFAGGGIRMHSSSNRTFRCLSSA